jgi:3-hydroxyacyl-[acyl-carrier-protein] dehydratase
MLMDINKIQEFLPHRFPFLLVDRVIGIEGEKIHAIKNVSMNEWFFQGHFPGAPVMPGVLVVEALAQAGGILAITKLGDDAKGKVMFFMGIDAVKFRKPVVPGDQLTLKVEMIKLKGRIAKMKGEAFVGDELRTECEMLAMIVDK